MYQRGLELINKPRTLALDPEADGRYNMLMNPDQTPSPYDFILNDNNSKRSGSKLPLPKLNTSSRTGRVIFVVVIAVVLIVGLSLLFSILKKAGKPNVAALTNLAGTQAEIIRVSGLVANKAENASTTNFATTISSSVSSDQQALLVYLRKQGYKITDRQLSSAKNTKVDAALDLASKSNRFDEEFMATIGTKLQAYRQILNTRYQGAKNASEKKAIYDAYLHVGTLLAAPTASK